MKKYMNFVCFGWKLMRLSFLSLPPSFPCLQGDDNSLWEDPSVELEVFVCYPNVRSDISIEHKISLFDIYRMPVLSSSERVKFNGVKSKSRLCMLFLL